MVALTIRELYRKIYSSFDVQLSQDTADKGMKL